MAQRTGVESKTRLPRKNSMVAETLNVPPVITVRVPAAAVAIPKTCFLVSSSLNILAEKMVMRIGERRQTRIEAIDAPAIWIPVY